MAFAKVYDRKNALVAADLLNDQVLPFFAEHRVPLLRALALTNRGTEYCGQREHHEYQLYLAVNVRERWRRGDPEVVDAMRTWASYAERGRKALLHRDYQTFDQLIDANFDLRARIYRISEGNLEMIRAARASGATAKFAGSGGAIVGTYKDDAMYRKLVDNLHAISVAVVKPQVVAPAETALTEV